MKVRDVMSKDVQVARPGDTLQEVASRMASGDFGFMPVADGDTLIGTITDRDLTVRALAQGGFVTGASGRNWAGYGQDVGLPADFAAEDRALLTDPQTSGGLLVSCDPASVDEVLALFAREGFGDAAVIGRMAQGAPRVSVA